MQDMQKTLGWEDTLEQKMAFHLVIAKSRGSESAERLVKGSTVLAALDQ